MSRITQGKVNVLLRPTDILEHVRQAVDTCRPAIAAGYGGPRDIERAHKAGFDEHVTKPVDPEALLRLIDASVRSG